MNITLPAKQGSNSGLSVNLEELVVIGANGSGKKRFGSDIEKRYRTTHRISAQKSLAMPRSVFTKSKAIATNELLFGMHHDVENYAECLMIGGY